MLPFDYVRRFPENFHHLDVSIVVQGHCLPSMISLITYAGQHFKFLLIEHGMEWYGMVW